MRTALAMPLAAIVAVACVEEPTKPDFLLDLPSPLEEACQNTCEFPPQDFNLELLPATKARLDGGADPDLVIPNSPDNPEEWGFFVVRDMGAQQGTLRAERFVRTRVRPLACHVEAFDAPVPARVFIFGEDEAGAGQVEIYRLVAGVPESEVEGQEEPLLLPNPLPASPVMTAGHFDNVLPGGIPDVVVSIGGLLYTLSCDGNGCASGLQLLDVDNGLGVASAEPIPADKMIRFLEPRVSTLGTGVYAFLRDGYHDLVVAAESNVRWYSYAHAAAPDLEPRWRSFTEFQTDNFQVGVMGSLTSAVSGQLLDEGPGSAPNDLVLGGVGALDITDIKVGAGATQVPGSRYEWVAASDELGDGTVVVGAAVANLSGVAQKDIIFVGEKDGVYALVWVPNLQIVQEGDWTTRGRYSSGTTSRLELPFADPISVYTAAPASAQLWVLSKKGDCRIYEEAPSGGIKESELACAF